MEHNNQQQRMGYDIDDPRVQAAANESGLAAEFADNPVLLRFYMKRLMVRGWAGVLTPEEKLYTQLVRKAYGTGPSDAELVRRAERLAAYRQRPNEGSLSQPETRLDAKTGKDTSSLF